MNLDTIGLCPFYIWYFISEQTNSLIKIAEYSNKKLEEPKDDN